ncbi:MAG: AAA family ATPase [Chitinophagales bacterium]|nr:AAA family ATPase [Chitinophagales bacterium]
MENLTELFQYSKRMAAVVRDAPPRYVMNEIDFHDRLIGLMGSRGVGKTTLMLQYLNQKFKSNNKGLYVSMDYPSFSELSLVSVAESFEAQGGKTLFVDEVHKYDHWSAHLKGIYDTLPELHVIFSGSSAVHLHKGKGDLSRRASIYKMSILSFREFLQLETGQTFEAVSLDDILKNHVDIAFAIKKKVKPLSYFNTYLKTGAYPFYLEGKQLFSQKLISMVNQVIESDLVMINNIEGRFINKMKKLLYMIASSLPFIPNITKLSETTGISRPLLYQYLEYLQDAELISMLHSKGKGYSTLIRSEKIYINNTNLVFALANQHHEIGSIRETFFMSMLKPHFLVEATYPGDFFVEKKFTFEIGGKGKTNQQIADLKNAFIAADDIETGFGNKIPLWLFGFLY